MQTYIYSIIHIVGIIILFMGLAYGMKHWSKGAAIAHGLGLVLILVSGFGLIARKYNNELHTWMFVKLAIWFALGGAIVLIKRKVVTGLFAWLIIVGLGAAAAWTVYHGITLLG